MISEPIKSLKFSGRLANYRWHLKVDENYTITYSNQWILIWRFRCPLPDRLN
jgi:hypothetical protein